MTKGDGSVYPLDRNRWRVSVDFGTNPVTGKRERVTRVVNGSKVEARKVRDQIKQEHEQGLTADGSKVTFSEFLEVWHQSYMAAGTAAPITVKKEYTRARAAVPYIGDIPMREIDARIIETMYATIRQDKQAAGRRFGGTSMHKLHVRLKQIFSKAVDYNIILRNPFDHVTAPRKDEPGRKALPEDEYMRLLACAESAEQEAYTELTEKEARQFERNKAFGRSSLCGIAQISCAMAVRIDWATGMRRGEVFGLIWGNVDLDLPSIKVCQTYTNEHEIKEPKSEAGTRDISIDKTTAEHLAIWKTRQAMELAKIGIQQNDDTPVCCTNTGGWFDMNNFERWWRPWREANGFAGLKFHEIRHTHATWLLAHGVDIKTVQTRMGHSDASITLSWYAHAVPENDRKAANMLGELATKEPKNTPILEVKIA